MKNKLSREVLENRIAELEQQVEICKSDRDKYKALSENAYISLDQAAQALKQSEARYRTIVENSSEDIWQLDLNGKVTYVSPAVQTIFGYTAEEALKLDFANFFPETELEKAREAFIKAAGGELSQRLEFFGKRKDGSSIPIEVSVTPLMHEDNIVGVQGIARDITDRKVVQEMSRINYQKYRMIYDQSPIAIRLYDSSGRLMDVNPSCLELLGVANQHELEGQDIFSDPNVPEDVKTRLKKGNVVRYQAVFDFEKIKAMDLYQTTRQGTIWLDVLIAPLGGASPVGYMIQAQDITLRMKALEALQESEARYRLLADNVSDAIWVMDLTTQRFTYCSPSIRTLRGYRAEEVLEQPLDQIMPPGSLSKALDALSEQTEKVVKGVFEPVIIDLEFFCKDGTTVWGESKVSFIYNADGIPESILGVTRDISERKRAEAALKKSLQMAADIVQTIPSGFFIYQFEPPGKLFLLSANPEAERLTGIREDEWKGREFNEIWPEAKAQGITDDFLSAIWTGNVFETEDLFYTDHRLTGAFRVRAFALPGDRLAVAFENIYEHKLTETKLQESEKQFRMVFDASPDSININRLEDGRYVDVNQAFIRLTGYTREDVIGKTPIEVNIWHDPDVRECFRRELQEKGVCNNLEAKFRCKDGRLKTALLSARVIRLQNVSHIIAIIRDITERKQAEVEREKLMTAIEYTGEAIVVTGLDGIIQFVNHAFETITGYARDEAIGQNPRILKSGKQDNAFYQNLWATISGGDVFIGEMINRRKDGRLYNEEIVISPVRDTKGDMINYVAVKRDITEQKKLEEQLRQSQRMESIGTLAGGIAHDFNNILYPIIGHSEMLADDLAGDARLQKRALAIMNSALRAADLVKQILSFSRQPQQGLKPVKIHEIINEVILLIRHSIPAFIEINLRIDDACRPVLADPGQIHQVIMNLISNANLAMEGVPGKLEIGLSEVMIDPDSPLTMDLVAGPYIDFSVSDTGVGMDEIVISRIFDPFFSTRDVGKGTGLGLSVSYGIIKQHGGTIRVESRRGRGSVFHVFLPIITTPSSDEKQTPVSLPNKGDEHILFVDDAEVIVELVEAMLNRLGYRVTSRLEATGALAEFKKDPDSFDLVITDMIMPDMTGVDLVAAIREVRPEFPIIICTGFSERMDEEIASALGLNAFLMKPVSRDQLAAVVRRVLDERAGV